MVECEMQAQKVMNTMAEEVLSVSAYKRKEMK